MTMTMTTKKKKKRKKKNKNKNKKKKKKKKKKKMMMMMMMRACSCYADRGTGQRPSMINLRDDDSQHENDGKSTAGLVCLSPAHCFT